MPGPDPLLAVIERRERDRDADLLARDPIASERLTWQAQSFRHLAHLLPGETVLEIGSGQGLFAATLARVTRGRNPITAARVHAEAPVADARSTTAVEHLRLDGVPGLLAGRRFRYVVTQNMLDRNDASRLLAWIAEQLQDGGQVVCFESNPWNPVLVLRNAMHKLLRRSQPRSLVSRPELYELFSDVGFVRVWARFTDFIFPPLPRRLRGLMRNLSILLENAPFVRIFAGRILIHAQRPPREVARRPVSLARHPTLKGAVSVVVPCHDEEMNVRPLVEGLIGLYGDYLRQIVLVDDNSTDATRAVIEELTRKDARVTGIFRRPPNGVGRALRDGLAATTGAWVLTMDCDFQHLLPELEDLFDAAAEGADAVLGSRFSRLSVLINYPFGKILANRTFHLVANLMFRFRRRDLTNNLKLMRAQVARRLVIDEPWFAANAEIGLQLALMGIAAREVPVSWINRSFDMGRSSFRVLASGGGYARVLARYAVRTRLGLKPLAGGPAEAGVIGDPPAV